MMGREERIPGFRDSGIPGFQTMTAAVGRDCGGTVLMESVLVLPFLLMLITGIFQFARFWQARLYTQYAAFNAARAALVYNPVHYRNGERFLERDGVVWLAAVSTLSWISDGGYSGGDSNFRMPGYGWVPRSRDVAQRVRISAARTDSYEQNGWVKVTVEFDYPTILAVYDPSPAWPGSRSGKGTDGVDRLANPKKFRYFTFRESCLLPKPWSTVGYPHIGGEEWRILRSDIGGS